MEVSSCLCKLGVILASKRCEWSWFPVCHPLAAGVSFYSSKEAASESVITGVTTYMALGGIIKGCRTEDLGEGSRKSGLCTGS